MRLSVEEQQLAATADRLARQMGARFTINGSKLADWRRRKGAAE